jgi:phytanoyl-CoA hydroxylase
MILTTRQRADWNRHGYLIVPGFFDEVDVDAIASALDRSWTHPNSTLVADDLVTGRRQRAIDVHPEDRVHPFKVNDLYLERDEVRRVCLSEGVGKILTELLEDEPVLVNTLNLAQSSQQPDHVDSLYMTPHTAGGLIATWMALEDVLPDSGPLRYYPESHQIEQFRFSDGTFHANDEEMPQWAEYMAGTVEKRGLEETTFLAKKGDLFIWHAHLLHGGSEIETPGRTRNSLVSHFWTATDAKNLHLDIKPLEQGYWYDRPPQPIPGQPATGAADAAPVVAEPSTPLQGLPQPKQSLWERLRRVRAVDD